MTMDQEVLDEGCKNCSALRNEIDKKNAQIEHNNAQQLTGFLTLKQKIIGTDKLIREYQASKVERDILTRKNEEFVHLIDQLHRDLSIHSQDYTQLCGNAELLRKANSEYEVKVNQLSEETQKWKSQAEAGHNFTSQLVEKVKILEKYEEEVKHTAAVSRECEKTESKLQTLRGQLKDAKETATKSKRELTKIQKDYTQLDKYAKQWGKIVETQGKLGALHKRFFVKLCDKEARETEDDVDPDNIGANEIDEQSKLLEHLLDDGNGSESVKTSTVHLPKDTELTGGNLASLSKLRGKSPGDSTFNKQTEQGPIRAERINGKDKETPSKFLSPNKTPSRSTTTRARIRTASETSISQSSDADNALESGKENNKRPGPRTRSRSVKKTLLPGPESPALFHTPEYSSAVVQSSTSKSIDDMPCRSLVSMDTLLMTETTPMQGDFSTIDLQGSLSSAEFQLESPGPKKTCQDDRTFAKTSPILTTESIVGVKPLVNLFEPDVSDDTPQQRTSEAGTGKVNQYGAKAQSEVETSVNSSSLFGFYSDSSSDSDFDMIPVPSCQLPITNKNQDRKILQDSSSSLTACLNTVEESTSNSSRKSAVVESLHSPAVGTDMQCTNNGSRSIFALKANLEINSPTQDLNASRQEKTSELPCQQIAVPFTRSLEEETKTVIPDTGDVQVLDNCHDIGTVSNADDMQKPGNETPTVESNRDTRLLVANQKNIEESAAKHAGIFSEKLDEPSSLMIIDATENDVELPTREVAKDLASGKEKTDAKNMPTSIFALDINLGISSTQPDSDVAKPTKETKSDSSNVEVVLEAPLTLDEEPSTVVQESVEDPTSHQRGDKAQTVEVNQELPSEMLSVETDRESELIGVDRENLRESPGVEMDMPFEKHEKKITEQVDENEIEDKSVTSKPLQEPTSETGESNSRDAPTNIMVLDVDVDITFSQPSLDGVKLTEEENSELTREDPLFLYEEPNTVVQGTLNVQDSSEMVRVNEELHSEVPEVETNRESEPLVVSDETLVEHLCTERDVSSKIHEETNPLQTDESNISEENVVTQKSLQVPASETGVPYTTNALRSIFAVDLGLDISTSESESDLNVTRSAKETESKLLDAEVADQSLIHSHEDPVIATPGSVNVQGPDSRYGCDPVLEEFCNEVQPVEVSPECELSVVNDKNLGEFVGMKMDIPPRKQEEQMEGESRGTKMVVLFEEHEETNPEQIDELTKSKDKSSSEESPQDPMPKMGESDSNMARPTTTKSELPNAEVTSGTFYSSDPTPGNFVPESVAMKESDTGQPCSHLSNVGSNIKLRGAVLANESDSESKILSICSEDDSGESPYGRIDMVPNKHEEQNTEQIDGLSKIDKEMVTRSPICPALGTDESENTNDQKNQPQQSQLTIQSSIFASDVDLDMSSSDPESYTMDPLVEEKLELANQEVIHQRPSVGEPSVAVITKSVDEQHPLMETDIAIETHEEPSSQFICTSTESVEKPPTGIWERYPASGPGESDTNNGPCSISALNADLDISSSEPDSDETNLVEESNTELPNSEVNIQMPFSLDEDPSLVLPEKVIVQSSGSYLSCAALSNVKGDEEPHSEVPIVEGNRESGEVSEKVVASAIIEKEKVLDVDESLSKKATEGESGNEVQTTPDVVEPKLTLFRATPTRQTAVPRSPPNPSSRVVPGHILSSIHPLLAEETPEVDTSILQDAARPSGAASPCPCPVENVRDGNPANKDSQLHRSSLAQEPSVFPSISSNLPESATFPQATPTPPQILQPVRTSAFKVPRVPDASPRVSDVISADLTQTYPWSRGFTQGVKRSAADDEVAVILKQIRTNIIEIPATVSPLPKSPDPQPAVPVKIEEPKSRFPVLPRCAFNWTGKKLPLSDKLTERLGAYLHPGVQARVRFRRVSRRLRDIRSPDVLSNCFQGAINFAEAERRPKPTVNSVQLFEDVTDLIGWEDNATEPTQKPVTSVQNQNDLPEKRSSASFSTEEVDEFTLPVPNSTPSSKRKRKVKTNVRPKTTAPALFGSSSSESECESTVVSEPIQETRSTSRNLKEKKLRVVPSKESMQTPSLVNTSRAQVLAQLIEPIVPLGRANRSDFTPIKPNEVRGEAESMFNPNRVGLGLGRGTKTSQHTISPCSDALLSAAIKSKTMSRVIASPKHILKEPQVSREPVIATPIVPDSHPVQDKSTFRKRISHSLKRGLDSDPVVSEVSPASKRGRNQCEALPTAASQSAELNVAAETLLEESSVTARTRSKSRSAFPIKPQETVKLGVTNQSSTGNEMSQFESVQSKNLSCTTETIEDATSGNDTEPDTAVLEEMSSRGTSQSCSEREKAVTISCETENNILNEDARSRHQLLENSERSIVEENSCPPDDEVYPRSPDVEDSPCSPDLEESPRSPDTEVSQTPASCGGIEERQPTAFEFVLKELPKSPPIIKKVTKLKKDINLFVNRVFKNPDVTEESWNGLIERAMRFDSKNHPFILIRKLIASVIKDWDSPIDLSKTPPAPPMTPVHQRCVMILKELDEANSKLIVEPSENLHMFSNLFLSESSAVMFQQNSSLTLEEMCSLARAYTAVCRSRASLSRARTFLFDCLYFVPPRSYALTYTIVSVWADVLRQISFPLGPSCIDQTAAYLLLHNCKIKAVPGIAGKVLQMRSFMQNTYGYKNVATRTIDDLVNYLMTRFKETNSADEASSLSWSLALLGRWEGIDFAIEVIEKQLWPFLQRWSSGEGTNSGAAAVIVAIGMLGKTVPSSKRAGVKRVLSAMKVLLQSDEVIPSIHEAAIEAVVLLGEDEDPKSVIEVVKAWKLVNTNLSEHLLKVLKAFLKRHSSLVLPSH